ncbi:MAG: hypothetical protein Q7T46_05205 [Polaromonas sp.]|nr:hypothetical protein [Polaromonas sp.]
MKRLPRFFIPAGLLALGFLAGCQDVKSPKAPPAIPTPKASTTATQWVMPDLVAIAADPKASF